mmetsp:Transcript_100407/g.323664  ORF Transcript_100407/g.323664 Transcript_100407/m.323664 type:complete len:291 (+) Transcript_100407:72-944(+)
MVSTSGNRAEHFLAPDVAYHVRRTLGAYAKPEPWAPADTKGALMTNGNPKLGAASCKPQPGNDGCAVCNPLTQGPTAAGAATTLPAASTPHCAAECSNLQLFSYLHQPLVFQCMHTGSLMFSWGVFFAGAFRQFCSDRLLPMLSEPFFDKSLLPLLWAPRLLQAPLPARASPLVLRLELPLAPCSLPSANIKLTSFEEAKGSRAKACSMVTPTLSFWEWHVGMVVEASFVISRIGYSSRSRPESVDPTIAKLESPKTASPDALLPMEDKCAFATATWTASNICSKNGWQI